jgi:hypothetical protein
VTPLPPRADQRRASQTAGVLVRTVPTTRPAGLHGISSLTVAVVDRQGRGAGWSDGCGGSADQRPRCCPMRRQYHTL